MKENPISKYLGETGLTQQDLSQLTGFAPPMISEWRRDLKHPSLHNAFALERATRGRIPAAAWVGREIRRAG